MKFISTRDIIVRSKKTGHAIMFKKGVPTLAPEGMHEEIIERGVLPADGETTAGEVLDSKAPRIVLPPEDGSVRAKAILEVIKAMVKRNAATEFTAGGTPSAASVTSALGWKVDQKEVRQVWEKNREQLLRGAALSLE